MDKERMLRQLETEYAQALRSAAFWRAQGPFGAEEPLKVAAELALDRAEANATQLQRAMEIVRSADAKTYFTTRSSLKLQSSSPHGASVGKPKTTNEIG